MRLLDYLLLNVDHFSERLTLAIDFSFENHCPLDWGLVDDVWDSIEEYAEDFELEFFEEFNLSADDLEIFDIEDYLWSVEI